MNAVYFKYQAFDPQGKLQDGQLNADTEKEALRILRGRNLTPVKIERSKQASESIRRKKITASRPQPC